MYSQKSKESYQPPTLTNNHKEYTLFGKMNKKYSEVDFLELGGNMPPQSVLFLFLDADIWLVPPPTQIRRMKGAILFPLPLFLFQNKGIND